MVLEVWVGGERQAVLHALLAPADAIIALAAPSSPREECLPLSITYPQGSELEKLNFFKPSRWNPRRPNISAGAMSAHKKSKHGDASTEKAGGRDAAPKKSAKKKKRRDDEAGRGPLSLLADESAINPALSSLFAPKVSLSSFVLSAGKERRLTLFYSLRHLSWRQKFWPESHPKTQYQMTCSILQSRSLRRRLMKILVG